MKKLLQALLISSITLSPLAAKEMAEKERAPVDIRRTTFVVNDAEKSLELYRDALGLQVIYDQMINSPMENGETRKRRLVFLKANHDYVGVLGILQYIHPLKPQRQEKFNEPVPGDPITVINVDNLDSVWPNVVKSSGVKVIDKPELKIYPRGNGEKIRVMQTMIQDADGYWIEVNQLLDKPATSLKKK